ncbi:hypothetical protein SCHPADRAFT_894784 [Schizopora paradoxa]|uniref:Uncharacterized protein n=1 Tax=Schizopora paradoxa TaxID=27342 RepID=A0A0H2RCQ7_9AGAM|nr:hypothetical protein SCHPADRAFT_894784 [Schizopora paradoxa]
MHFFKPLAVVVSAFLAAGAMLVGATPVPEPQFGAESGSMDRLSEELKVVNEGGLLNVRVIESYEEGGLRGHSVAVLSLDLTVEIASNLFPVHVRIGCYGMDLFVAQSRNIAFHLFTERAHAG